MPRLSKIGAAALAAFGWTGLSTVTATYLQVAGGGAGGSWNGTVYGVGGNGSNSQFGTLTASVGGGGGGTYPGSNAGSGGSGGGGTGYSSPQSNPLLVGGSGTSGQGNAGGSGQFNGGNSYYGGGGGGAGAAGANASSTNGNGGVGLASSISGTSTYYAGGGGGGSWANSGGSAGTGGNGGGGNGAESAAGSPGTANTGGGGGAGDNGSGAGQGGGGAGGYLTGTVSLNPTLSYTVIVGAGGSSSTYGGKGGSGVVIISYPAPQQFGGGVVTTSGSNVIHTFNTSGTLSPLSSLTASYLVVAGGAPGGPGYGGGGGGGGGAGGLLSGSGLTIDTNSTYVVTVGSGGAGGTYTGSRYSNGSNSTFSAYVTAAVGGGAGGTNAATTGASGGSGGGGGCAVAAGGAGTSGQGNTGGAGAGTFGAGYYTGGGGGGAGAVGQDGQSGAGGAGGVGVASSISGTSTYYAGGGGGGGIYTGSVGGAGGNGGGGAGAVGSASATSGTANTGGGGGGTSNNSSNTSGNGGSGVVIISYAGSVQQMAGGTVTISGGNVIHTFTSSGYLTPLKFVGNSLRFRSSASAYLSRTPASAGNSTSFTYSLWVKRGILSAYEPLYHSGTSNANGSFVFGSNDTFSCQLFNSPSANYGWSSTMVFRDPASWYHIVIRGFASSSSNSYGGVELALYVNGVQQTFTGAAFNTPTTTNRLTDATAKQIGGDTVNTAYYDGYLSEFNYIDGQALTPNSFGTFNSYGVWQPITYGGSYGTNGFYLPFNKPSTSTYAASFNGTSQSISVASNSVFNFAGAFTVECWLNTSTVTNVSQPCLFSIGSDAAGLVLTYSSGNFYGYFVGTGGLFNISYTPYLNSWVHIAWVRQVAGGTHYLYVNGIQVATGTSGGTISSTGGVTVGKAGSSGTSFGYLSGTVSNFRVNNTALYTANFIPSTSPLTAVTGTQLLTLQNSTIIDNSTNAFSITNNGTVTTSANTNVFVNPTTLAVDQSPAGNNWTPNNISLTAGSTYDSMTDVPTLTSTTVANYCVLNPLDKGTTITIQDANLTSTIGATHNGVRGTFQIPKSGKWYWEVAINTTTTNSIIGSFGVATAASSLNTYDYNTTGTYSLYCQGSPALNYVVNGSLGTTFGSAVTGGTVCNVAYDADNGQLYLGVANTYYSSAGAGTGNPSTATNPSMAVAASLGLFPYIHVYNETINVNFGQQPWIYSPPSGFVALNTYNL